MKEPQKQDTLQGYPSPHLRSGDELGPGERIADYRIDAKLGEGSSAIVYAATEVSTGTPAAIKVLHAELAEVPEAIESLLEEARIVNSIGHPNIAAVFGHGSLEDGRPYIVMEKLPGETLHDRLLRGPIPMREALWITDQICAALAAVHGCDFVHGDIKPANLFLAKSATPMPTVRLLDFGVARPRADSTTAVVGSSAYMAPEQRDQREAGPGADLYSVGVVLLEMLTGDSPSSDETRFDARIAAVLAAADDLPRQLSAQLTDVAMHMLADDAALRPMLTHVRRTLHLGLDALEEADSSLLEQASSSLPDDDSQAHLVATALVDRRRTWLRPPILLSALFVIIVAVFALPVFAGDDESDEPTPAPATTAAPTTSPAPVNAPTTTAAPAPTEATTMAREPAAKLAPAARKTTNADAGPAAANKTRPRQRSRKPRRRTPSRTPTTSPPRIEGDAILDPFATE